MRQAQKETVGLSRGAAEKRGVTDTPRPTLAEAGIDKSLG